MRLLPLSAEGLKTAGSDVEILPVVEKIGVQ